MLAFFHHFEARERTADRFASPFNSVRKTSEMIGMPIIVGIKEGDPIARRGLDPEIARGIAARARAVSE